MFDRRFRWLCCLKSADRRDDWVVLGESREVIVDPMVRAGQLAQVVAGDDVDAGVVFASSEADVDTFTASASCI